MVEGTEPAGTRETNEPSAHSGAVKESATYLIYTFFAGQRIDTHEVANRLLKAGVAETVYSAAMPEVRVAPRYGGLTELLHRTDAVREYLTGPITIRAGLRVWLKYPRSGASLFPLIRVFAKVRAQLWFYKRTAFFRTPVEPDPDGGVGDGDSFDLMEFAKELIEQMESVNAGVIRSVARAQGVGAVQVEMDRRLLRPDYWMSEPYLRLGLRSSRQRFVVDPCGRQAMDLSPETTRPDEVREPESPGKPGQVHPGSVREDDDSWVEVDALALLHRSGVVQVMLRFPLPDDLTTNDLIGRVSSKTEIIAASMLPEPLLEPMQLANLDSSLSGSWHPELVEGVRWREIEFDGPTSFDDLFLLYFQAFEEAMPKIGPNWMCYPVLMVDGVTCGCSPEEWKDRHRIELAGVMFQHGDAKKFRPALIDGAVQDVSHLNEMVVLLNEARGVVMRWGEHRTLSWVDDLHTLIPIEQALLQRGQLSSLEWQFARAASNPKNLERLEEAIITGLDGYRSSRVNPGDAQILVDRILEKSRALTGYSRLMDSVNQLHQKVTAAEAGHSARQANFLAFLAVLVAVALGLPAIKQSIGIAETVPKNSALAPTAKPLVWLGEQGPAGVWAAFLVLAVVAIGTWAAGALLRRSWQRRERRRPAGRAWDVPLEVTISERGDEPDESDSSMAEST